MISSSSLSFLRLLASPPKSELRCACAEEQGQEQGEQEEQEEQE